MADAKTAVFYGVEFGGSPMAVEPDSISVSTEGQEDEIFTGAVQNPHMINVRRKRPTMKFTLLDIATVSGWTAFGSSGSVSSVAAFWRSLSQNGSIDGSWHSITMNQGVILPVSLRADVNGHASMECTAIGAYSGGVAYTLGSSSTSHSSSPDVWYPENVVIGSDEVLSLESVDCSWNYEIIDDNQHEPEYYCSRREAIEGSATALDHSLADLDRLEAGTEEQVTFTFRKHDDSASTSIALGNCFVKASVSGSSISLTWRKLHQ